MLLCVHELLWDFCALKQEICSKIEQPTCITSEKISMNQKSPEEYLIRRIFTSLCVAWEAKAEGFKKKLHTSLDSCLTKNRRAPACKWEDHLAGHGCMHLNTVSEHGCICICNSCAEHGCMHLNTVLGMAVCICNSCSGKSEAGGFPEFAGPSVLPIGELWVQ